MPLGNLRDAFMPLPFKGPNPALYNLDFVVNPVNDSRIADMQVGDGNQGAAVGTTVALLERGSRVMSAIHKIISMMKCDSCCLQIHSKHLPPVYPYDVVGGRDKLWLQTLMKIDIIPVADPNVFHRHKELQLRKHNYNLLVKSKNAQHV